MFVLDSKSWYGTDDEQKASGYFLILASDRNNKLYAAVRYVRMAQCGQFMMGQARIAGESLIVSGTYGGDGLPKDYDKMSDAVKAQFAWVGAELQAAYWSGEGGHNSAGSEGPTMAKYGKELAKARRDANRRKSDPHGYWLPR